jgi:predicted MarR family transcription regulator
VGTEFENMELEDVIKKSSGGIYNQAARSGTTSSGTA